MIIVTATETPSQKDITNFELEKGTGWAYCWIQYQNTENYFPILVPDGTVFWYSCLKCTKSTYTAHIRTYDDPWHNQEMQTVAKWSASITKRQFYEDDYKYFGCSNRCTASKQTMIPSTCKKSVRSCFYEEIDKGRCSMYGNSCGPRNARWLYGYESGSMDMWLLQYNDQISKKQNIQRGFTLEFKVSKEDHPVLKFA